MNHLKSILFSTAICISVFVQAQHPILDEPLNYELSEVFKLRGAEAGYFAKFLGFNDQHLFVLLVDKNTSNYKLCKKAWIQKIDKETMKQVAKVELLNGSKAKLEQVYLVESGIVVVREEELNRKDVKVFADKWSYDLVKKRDMVELLAYNKKETRMAVKGDSDEPFITVLTQDYIERGEVLEFDYNQFDHNLLKQRSGHISLGLISSSGKFFDKRAGVSSILNDVYQVKSGDLVAFVRVSKDADNPSQGSEVYLKFIRTSDNSILEESIELADEAYIREYKFLFKNDKLVVLGFYSDPKWVDQVHIKDWKLETEYKTNTGAISGTFLFEYDLNSFQLENHYQQPLNEQFILEVEARNPLVKKFDAEKRKSSTYKINNVEYDPVGNYAIISCEYAINYVITTTVYNHQTRNDQTSRSYHSKRGNAFFFKVNTSSGEIDWVTSVIKDSEIIRDNRSAWNTTMMSVISNTKKSTFKVVVNERTVRGEGLNVRLHPKTHDANFFVAEIDKSNGRATITIPNEIDKKLKPHLRLHNILTKVDHEDGFFFTRNQHLTKRVGRSILLNALIPTYFIGIGILPGYFYAQATKLKKHHSTYTIGRIEI